MVETGFEPVCHKTEVFKTLLAVAVFIKTMGATPAYANFAIPPEWTAWDSNPESAGYEPDAFTIKLTVRKQCKITSHYYICFRLFIFLFRVRCKMKTIFS